MNRKTIILIVVFAVIILIATLATRYHFKKLATKQSVPAGTATDANWGTFIHPELNESQMNKVKILCATESGRRQLPNLTGLQCEWYNL